jgi:phosphatidylserine/phosphatidylglycerophosphate/cardiolipin synthase-like enzyme
VFGAGLLAGSSAFAETAPLAGSPFEPFASAVQTALPALPLDRTVSNHVALVSDGYEALLLRIHLVRHARRSLDIQTFIWTNDECGRLMMYELIQAARRGVRVRVLADHLVSDQDPDTVAFLATVHSNLLVRHYRPTADRIRPSVLHHLWAGLWSFNSLNQRMHNKTLIVDGSALITGGRNIENTYYNHSTEMNFRDRDLLVIGPIVAEAARSFESFWTYRHSVPSGNLVDVAETLRANTFRRYETREDFGYHGFFAECERLAEDPATIRRLFVDPLHLADRVRFVADEPGKARRFLFWNTRSPMARELANVVAQARDQLTIQSPYLVLSDAAQELIRSIRRTRPALRIVVSSNSFGSTDNLMAYSANYLLRALYIESLGLEVHEFKPHPGDLLRYFAQYPDLEARARPRIEKGEQTRLPFLCVHAKSLVVDDRIAFVGSFNLDPRSENLNTEVGLVIEDTHVASALKEEILRDASSSNSWVIACRQLPLHLDRINTLVDGLLGLSPIDLWPLQNTTSFDRIPGHPETSPSDPSFYQHYREAGDFPGAEGPLTEKEIYTRIYKAVGPTLTPLL